MIHLKLYITETRFDPQRNKHTDNKASQSAERERLSDGLLNKSGEEHRKAKRTGYL